ncbi:MAG: proton-conducting transporter membrane subunit [Planctomycetaceae bacterium]
MILVMSCNLVMLTIAWMLTSLGLHQLLTHYPDRTWALWAARKKFLISRLGDAMLIGAVVLAYRIFGTTEYSIIFAAADAIRAGEVAAGWGTELIGGLLVLGAMTKSAQFPFHSWLPDTMETPTPVSALMHAGVINAGGFLVIRLSPLVSLSPLALNLLALVGALTALLGAVVMLTQTSIKRSLAYSTIAQMGFMMLQCGLGAFTAALLHIVSHSVYKAYCFLRSGSVLENAAGRVPAVATQSAARSVRVWQFAAAIAAASLIAFGAFLAFGIDVATKPGGVVLGLVLILALTQHIWRGVCSGNGTLSLQSLVQAALIAIAYSAAYRVTDSLLASSTSYRVVAASRLDIAIMLVVSLGFLGVFLCQMLAGTLSQHRWARALYIHAINGFYIDIPARRLTAWFYGQGAPVQ